MSIVCCRVLKDTIEIASDSITVRGHTQEREKGKYAKLAKINEIIIGGVGWASETSLLQMFCETRQPKQSDEYSIMIFFSEFSEWKKKKTEKYEVENAYIFAFKGRVFYVHGFFVKEILTYDAIGAGMDYALSALYLGHDVSKAAETSCELSVYCEKPIKKLVMARAS